MGSSAERKRREGACVVQRWEHASQLSWSAAKVGRAAQWRPGGPAVFPEGLPHRGLFMAASGAHIAPSMLTHFLPMPFGSVGMKAKERESRELELVWMAARRGWWREEEDCGVWGGWRAKRARELKSVGFGEMVWGNGLIDMELALLLSRSSWSDPKPLHGQHTVLVQTNSIGN